MIDLEQFEKRLRQPNASIRTEEEPLAELARLGDGPEDPFKSVFEAQAFRQGATTGDGQDPYEADRWAAPGRHDFDEEERRLDDISESIKTAPPLSGALEFGMLANGASSFHESDAHAFETSDQSEDWRYEDGLAPPEAGFDEMEPRSRRPLYVMAAIIIAGIVGIGASFAFKDGSASHEVAMIKAVDGPAKVQPEATSSSENPNKDASILDRTPQAAPVAIADATEQPVDFSRMPDRAPREQPAATNSGAASVAVPPSPSRGLAPAPAAPQSIAALIEPKKVKTVSVRPDGTVLGYTPQQTPPAVGAAPPAHPAAAATAKTPTPKSTARIATTVAKPIAAAGATDAARGGTPVQMADTTGATPEPAAASAGTGAFAVQLAAPPSEQEAREIQQRLIKKYGGAIAGFHPSIKKAVSGDKTVYRVRTVGLSKEEATALCQTVKSSGGSCFVARN